MAKEGEPLATIARKNGHEELRIALREYNGHPFIDLRVFFRNDAGEWRPSRTGVTVKPRELDEVIAALQKAQGRGR